MTYSIHYYSIKNNHIELKVDGTIELYVDNKLIKIEYEQAKILKNMIIVEEELYKNKE